MKYCIISINDRAKNVVLQNKKILHNFEYIDSIKYCDAKKENPWNVLNKMNIRTDTWSPYYAKRGEPLSGEIGIFTSLAIVYDFIEQNNLEHILVLEDDAQLSDNFVNLLNLALRDTPKDFDFLCLYSNSHENQVVTDRTNINKKYIHKAKNQGSGILGMVYSLNGAKKLLKLMKLKGTESTIDDFIFQQVRLNLINGYIIKPDFPKMMEHSGNIESTIDPDKIRPVD
jgi:GR25 family glycosyltransferase involved in LPS biosynthesis